MSYRLTEWDHAGRSATVELTNWRGNARFFKSALWRTQVKPEAEGCRVFCSTEFTLRPRYWFLAPVFYLTRRALGADLEALRRVLEST
jgi:hypothetical protein